MSAEQRGKDKQCSCWRSAVQRCVSCFLTASFANAKLHELAHIGRRGFAGRREVLPGEVERRQLRLDRLVHARDRAHDQGQHRGLGGLASSPALALVAAAAARGAGAIRHRRALPVLLGEPVVDGDVAVLPQTPLAGLRANILLIVLAVAAAQVVRVVGLLPPLLVAVARVVQSGLRSARPASVGQPLHLHYQRARLGL